MYMLYPWGCLKGTYAHESFVLYIHGSKCINLDHSHLYVVNALLVRTISGDGYNTLLQTYIKEIIVHGGMRMWVWGEPIFVAIMQLLSAVRGTTRARPCDVPLQGMHYR